VFGYLFSIVHEILLNLCNHSIDLNFIFASRLKFYELKSIKLDYHLVGY
jgi:hypothetical protein